MTQTLTTRAAVDGALRLARFPADRLIAIAPEGKATTAASLTLDRADARVRAVAAAVLRDPEMRIDAHRRDEAADRRERALRARVEADERTSKAAVRTEDRRANPNDAKAKAAQDVKQRRDRATDRRDKRKTDAENTTRKRKASARTTANDEKGRASSKARARKSR